MARARDAQAEGEEEEEEVPAPYEDDTRRAARVDVDRYLRSGIMATDPTSLAEEVLADYMVGTGQLHLIAEMAQIPSEDALSRS